MENEYLMDREQVMQWSWEDGCIKGLLLGVLIGSGMVALLGLTVCPRV